MTMFARLHSFWQGLWKRSEQEHDLDDEMHFHVEARADDLIRTGLSHEEALRRARIEFGCLEAYQDRCRESRRVNWAEDLVQDVRFALRMLRKSPGFTAVAVLTLALGIGANTAIFSVTYSILLRPLSYKDPGQLVTISALAPGHSEGSELSIPAIEAIESRTHVFAQVTFVEAQFYRLSGSGAPAVLETGLVSGNYFASLGVQPSRGRTILPSDAQSDSAPVAVLSYTFWQKHFGGDVDIVGKQIDLVDAFSRSASPTPYTVVGIGSPSFQSPGYGWNYDVWIPRLTRLHEDPAYMGGDNFTVGRLKRGVTLAQADAELHSLSTVLGEQYPLTDKGSMLQAQQLQDMIVNSSRFALLVLLGAVGFLLLIACANISNLMLVRGWGRLREVAIRESLGATRLRVIRQFLAESLLLSLLGCILGLVLAFAGVAFLRANAPRGTPRVEEIGLYSAVFWYALGISVVAGVAFGLTPALQVSGRKLSEALKGSGSGSLFAAQGHGPRRYRSVLVITEVALSVVLLIGSGLLVRSFANLVSVPLGLSTDRILSMDLLFDPATCKGGPQCDAAFEQVLARIRALPGVQVATVANYPPLEGGGINFPVRPEGWPETPPGQPVLVANVREVSPEYFSLMGIRLLQGRNFTSADAAGTQVVGVVNEAFARRFFSGDALGKRLHFSTDKNKKPIWRYIVGVVKDARDAYPWQEPKPELYEPFAQANDLPSGYILVRTAMEPSTLAPGLREQIWAVSKNTPIDSVETMDQILSHSVAEPRFRTSLIASFGALGLVLAMVGIYGVISYAVNQRTHEIGVRLALGAGPVDIARLAVGNGLLLTIIGIGIGSAIALGLTHYLRSLLFDVTPGDPLTFVGVVLLFLLVSLAASYIPARRAMRVDPMIALRHE
jgi:putative ABC transport system permease protein